MIPPTRTHTRLAALAGVVLIIVAGLTMERERAEAPQQAESSAALIRALQAPATVPRERAALDARDSVALAGARELSAAFVRIAESVTPAVVRIQSERDLATRGRGLRDLLLPEGQEHAPLPEMAGGTGFLVTEDGFILTNHHVVEGADRVLVSLMDKREFAARVVGSDPTTDVAVIKIDGHGLPAVPLGESESARVGEWVVAVGNPGFGGPTLDFTVTTGIISAKGRPLDIIPRELYDARNEAAAVLAIEDFIQTDAVINPGNSGGPLIDLDGRVIGINTAIASGTGFYQGYGFAIPIDLARRVMRDIVEQGRVRRALLGVTIRDVDPEDADVYGLPGISGVLVQDFADDSPARDAGIDRHDVIVGLDGQPVRRLAQLQRMVAQHRPGDEVRVDVIRFGERRSFGTRLTEADLPEPAARTAAAPAMAPRARGAEALGLVLVELTDRAASEAGFSRVGGALVARVRPFSIADRKQVREQERIAAIDRDEVTSAREAHATLRQIASGDVVSLTLVDRAGRTRIVNVRMP